MADQQKKPEKPAENEAAGSVYRIKDVTQSAWAKGALPLPGLDPHSSPTLTPLNKAEEDIAVDLAMTGEIPIALILEALAKQEANRAAGIPEPGARRPKQAPPKPRYESMFPAEPSAQPEISPLAGNTPIAPDSYAAVMIRPEEIVAPTPEQSEPPPPPTPKPQQPKKKAQVKADPQKVKAAKDEMQAMARRAKPVAEKPAKPAPKPASKPAPKPVMEAAEEFTPTPEPAPVKEQPKKPPQKQGKPPQQARKPAQAKPQPKPQPPKEKKPEPQLIKKPAASVKKQPSAKTVTQANKKSTPQPKKKPAVPAGKKPIATAAQSSAFQPIVPPQVKPMIAAMDAFWNDDVPLYNIPYREIAQTVARDIYYFGLRAARPLLMFRRRAVPVLTQPLLTLWHILRAMVMALYQITLGRAVEAFQAARAVHQASLGRLEKQSFPRRVRVFVRDYKPILRTAGNALLPLGAAAFLALVIVQQSGQGDKTLALQVTYGDQVFYVANENVVLAAQESALSHMTIDEGAAYAAEAKYEIVETSKVNLIDENTARDAIWQNYPQEMINACGVYVEDALVAVVRNESDASGTLESIKREHAGKMQLDEGDTIGFVEKIRLVQSIYPANSDKTMDAEGLYRLLTGAKEGEVFELARETDSLYSIAKRHDTTERWLERLNPQYVDAYLHTGDKVVIAQEVSFLQLTVTKTETNIEGIPYQTVDTNNAKLYKGEVRTTTKGVRGEEQVTKRVTYVNGISVKSEEIARVRILEPVTERREIGTKSTTVRLSDGRSYTINPSAQGFVWPVPALGQITSPYGYRGRSFHSGIDISGSGASGKLIVAAKDGVVESVQRSSSGLGNAVVINHGNGVKTRYGHMLSGSISVSPGERVIAGQPIGRVGSTGNSTGPHLHFEVIINGSTQNPRNYVSR